MIKSFQTYIPRKLKYRRNIMRIQTHYEDGTKDIVDTRFDKIESISLINQKGEKIFEISEGNREGELRIRAEDWCKVDNIAKERTLLMSPRAYNEVIISRPNLD